MSLLRLIDEPGRELCGESAEQFLRNLGGPACLRFSGASRGRCRAFVTLLHGNEPSGLLALRRWLLSGQRPAVDTVAIIASVHVALAQPMFGQRMPRGARDLNRCFRPPFDDPQGALARDILGLLDDHAPEAVVDMHNTSGSGPSFGVVNHEDHRHERLLSLFTDRVVVSPLDLGALMELSTAARPIVTAEVGGRLDAVAHAAAWQGLRRYFLAGDLLGEAPGEGTSPALQLDVLRHPLRVELRDGVVLGYGDQPQAGCDITLRQDIEAFNFGTVREDTCLGWVSDRPEVLFSALDGAGRCAVTTLLRVRDGRLYPARPVKLFMITSNADIALTDCLCYAVADDGGPLRSAA